MASPAERPIQTLFDDAAAEAARRLSVVDTEVPITDGGPDTGGDGRLFLVGDPPGQSTREAFGVGLTGLALAAHLEEVGASQQLAPEEEEKAAAERARIQAERAKAAAELATKIYWLTPAAAPVIERAVPWRDRRPPK